jgi:HEPN domain-containing protein
MGSKQLRFGDYEQSTGKKRTRRERFLAEMEGVVHWARLIDLIEPHYPKSSSKGGRPAYPLATMLRIHLMQHWYYLSDPAMEDPLSEVLTMRRFAGSDLMRERIPDETTILAFRHLLEKHNLGEQVFETVKTKCIEKLFKAELMRLGVAIPKTHGLRALSDLIRQCDDTWTADIHRLDRLSLAAVDLRYPDPSEPELEIDQELIVKIASGIRSLLLNRLGMK